MSRYEKINDATKSKNLNCVLVENVYEIYPKLQKVVLDIQTDIEFPNELRPKENNGYNTKYSDKF